MNVLALLRDKLQFIKHFYEKAAKPFETVKGQIEKGRGPYKCDPPGFDPEDLEPPYLDEWQEADSALNILGQSCLCVIQKSLREFLDGFVERSRKPKPKLKGNWFAKYQRFFKEQYKIDRTSAPGDLGMIEDISLTRNSIEHTEAHIRLFTLTRVQTKEHHTRFPDSIFTDEMDRQLMPSTHHTIKVTRQSLMAAMEEVEKFCAYIEQQWAG